MVGGAAWRSALARGLGLTWLRHARAAGAGWARVHDIDGASFVLLYLCLLLYLPASLVFRPLSSAGTPATMLAIFGALCWVLNRIMDPRARRPSLSVVPVTAAGGLFALCVVASTVVALARPLRTEELKSMNTGLLFVVAWAGVALVTSDGITSRNRLARVHRRLVLASAFVGLVGILQFVTGRTLTDMIRIPGLSANTTALVYARDGFSRVIGTTLNPIEFGVLMAAMLPLAINHGVHASTTRWRAWAPTVLIASSIPLSNSRSGLVALGVAMLVVIPTYSPAMRLRVLGYGLTGAMAVFVLVPGLLGTLLGLFIGIDDDPSAGSRTGSYALAGAFISRSPVWGRGFLTFLPEYRILDNQYLGLLIDVGVAGTAAFLLTMTTAVVVCWRSYRLSTDGATVGRSAALLAALSACTVSFAFFDALSFPVIAGFTALCLGLAECEWRFARALATSPVGGRPPTEESTR
ncbi:hypothetical protein ASG49_14620 [Marmoricola sp. Leaf446]|uniref:O-antigen ligase family protein n=1 Tax=Marmoricola sp. Leaf446 TaxID=1736379 RepID=UPI0006FE0BD7|nr:O-antigen ligase family protein [Marmoricola sp. Leaf446]KQT90941.1 hypothetical protein ASG49_14620 [Marmoricola sp. Leaf446]